MRNMKAILPGLIVAGLVGLLLLQHTEALNAETPGIFPELQKFTDCLDLIDKYYVEEVTPGKLIEGAIKGMTSTLDPHSTYLSKEDYKEMQISTTGSFGGLGIELGLRDSQLTVITPIEGTPAFKAGIRPGDRILKIDSTATTDMSLEEAVKFCGGPRAPRSRSPSAVSPKKNPSRSPSPGPSSTSTASSPRCSSRGTATSGYAISRSTPLMRYGRPCRAC